MSAVRAEDRLPDRSSLAAARVAVGEERLAEATRANRGWIVAAYERWCHDVGVAPWAGREEVLLAYLRAREEQWGHNHRKGVVTAINARHQRLAGAPLAGDRVRRYVRAVQRRDGTRREGPEHPLTADDLVAMVAAADTATGRDQLTRARLAVFRAAATAGITWHRPVRRLRELSGLPAEAFTTGPDRVTVAWRGHRLDVTGAADPLGEAALRGVLRCGQPRPLKLDGEGGAREHAQAWRRVRNLVEGRDALPTAAQLAQVSDRAWWWTQRLVPREATRSVRDTAWLLCAWLHGARFRELATALLDDARDHGDAGWLLAVARQKNDPDGACPLPLVIPHVRAADGCIGFCPACRLEAWVELSTAIHGRDSGPLFGTYYAGALRVMTRQNANLQLQRMWVAAGGDPQAKISTRSLRAGAAVGRAEAGQTVELIAAALRHGDERTARVYLRARDPRRVEVHIRL